MSNKARLQLLYTFTGSHPVQDENDDSVEYVITHNLGSRPMVYEAVMHRDDDMGGKLSFVNDESSLSSASEYGSFTVTNVTMSTLSLHMYKAGLVETEDFTFNIYG